MSQTMEILTKDFHKQKQLAVLAAAPTNTNMLTKKLEEDRRPASTRPEQGNLHKELADNDYEQKSESNTFEMLTNVHKQQKKAEFAATTLTPNMIAKQLDEIRHQVYALTEEQGKLQQEVADSKQVQQAMSKSVQEQLAATSNTIEMLKQQQNWQHETTDNKLMQLAQIAETVEALKEKLHKECAANKDKVQEEVAGNTQVRVEIAEMSKHVSLLMMVEALELQQSCLQKQLSGKKHHSAELAAISETLEALKEQEQLMQAEDQYSSSPT